MNTKKIAALLASGVGSLTMVVGAAALPAYAEVTANANVGASVPSVSARASAEVKANKGVKVSQSLQTIIDRGDKEIEARIDALNKLSAKVGTMKHISASVKATLSSQIQTEIGNLTSLKAKIDADTDLSTLQADVKSITGSYRIYALVIPETHILAAADSVGSVADTIAAIGVKLETRITAAETAGKNVTSLKASLSDLNAKLADAKAKAQLAQTGVSSLAPDGGDKAKAESNRAAMAAARANIKTATADLKAARQDAKTIVAGLKGTEVKTNVKAKTEAKVQ